MCPSERGDHLDGDQRRPGLQLRPPGRIGSHLGHQHVEVPFEPGEEVVQFGIRRGFGVGRAHDGLGFIHGSVDLHDQRVLAHPAPVEQPGGAIIAGPGVDLQHSLITGTMLNDIARASSPPGSPCWARVAFVSHQACRVREGLPLVVAVPGSLVGS